VRWLFRRIFWIGTGVSMGFGGAMWIRRRIQRAVEAVMPQRVQKQVARRARRAGGSVVGAVSEGRAAMRAREAEMRREYAPGRR
jgi:hypothetical protein